MIVIGLTLRFGNNVSFDEIAIAIEQAGKDAASELYRRQPLAINQTISLPGTAAEVNAEEIDLERYE